MKMEKKNVQPKVISFDQIPRWTRFFSDVHQKLFQNFSPFE